MKQLILDLWKGETKRKDSKWELTSIMRFGGGVVRGREEEGEVPIAYYCI